MGETTKHQSGSEAFTVVTGAAGFIGARLVCKLREKYGDARPLLLVDDLEHFSTRACCEPFRAMKGLKFLSPADFLNELERGTLPLREVFHMGACSRTDETREAYLKENNTRYTERVWNAAISRGFPLYYASSAATYGNGENGYVDEPSLIPSLKPMNLYGWSKQNFDLFVLEEIEKNHVPPHWAGFKFFNVYGPDESHKGSQATPVHHAFSQFTQTGVMKLFRSHREGIPDGGQMRDFVYIDDVCAAMISFSEHRHKAGIYNLGTGKARTFLELTHCVAAAMGIECKIDWIDTPERLRAHYQYFTEADLRHLRDAGYTAPFIQIEQGTKLAWAEWQKRHIK
jgi:ADP-L-glycero-D-manno-heptose 6-epimerase